MRIYRRMVRIIHMIAGFRGTGKDTLHKDLVGGKITFRKFSLPWSDYTWIPLWVMFLFRILTLGMCALVEFIAYLYGYPMRSRKWFVFANRSNGIRVGQEYLFVTRDRQQTAFARPLKTIVHTRINACSDVKFDDSWFERNKERKIRIWNTITTPRELYISTGETAKKTDPIIWARKCFKAFTSDKISQINHLASSEIIDITDWRFRNEQIYANFYSGTYRIFTTRIYRSVISIPTVSSERDLDNVATDILLVPSVLEMIFALIRWPQYARHMLIGELA